MKIENTIILGMGALGMLFGSRIHESIEAGESGKLDFVMDSKRYERHKKDQYTVNGEVIEFSLMPANTPEKHTADLIIFATKAGGLKEAIEEAAPFVGPNTIFMSFLNGISSEEEIGKRFGDKNLIYCTAYKMDAVREGTALRYISMGSLILGVTEESAKPALDAVIQYFDRMQVPYELSENIRRDLWWKWMVNIGTNQVCMIENCNYGTLLEEPALGEMVRAMEEVVALSDAAGIGLGQEDVERALRVIGNLDKLSYPSMEQDRLAKRKSEVDIFAGEAVRRGKSLGVPTPFNEEIIRRVEEIEKTY